MSLFRKRKPDAETPAHKQQHTSNGADKAGARTKRAPANSRPAKNADGAKPRRRAKLFTQILLSFIALSLVTALAGGMLNIAMMRRYVQDSTLNGLLSSARNVAGLALRSNGELKTFTAQQLDEWERLTGAQVVIVKNDMSLLTRQTIQNRRQTVTVVWPDPLRQYVNQSTQFSALDDMDDDEDSRILSAIDFALVSTVLAGNTVSDIRSFDFMEGTWAFAGVPVMHGEIVRGAVLLCQPISSIDVVTRNMSLLTSFAAAVSAAVAILLATLLTNRIVRPLARMTRTAQRMAEGNYGERIRDRSNTAELGQLSDALNLLSGNLNTSIRSLNQEKIKMELVLSGIAEGIIAINQIGNMVHCNDVAVGLLELNDDDAGLDVYHLTARSPIFGMLIQVLDGGDTINSTWKNGKGQSVSTTVSPIMMGDEIVGAVGLVRDVSEAERLEQLRRDYVANISHELRTPLTGIRGMVEPLIDGVYDTELEKQECYMIIYQETRRLERLITDMLDISRLQDGRVHIDLEEMQVGSMLDAVVRRLERRAFDQQVELRVVADDDPVVMGNEDRIMQVLIILVDNALKFTPAGGSITLQTRLSKEDGLLWLSVRDTGSGIAAEDLPYIFERFYKADKSRMETRGTGLGLAIARLVVELMGGTIWCESELGHGTKFEFSLHLQGWEPGASDRSGDSDEWATADDKPALRAPQDVTPAVIVVRELSAEPKDTADGEERAESNDAATEASSAQAADSAEADATADAANAEPTEAANAALSEADAADEAAQPEGADAQPEGSSHHEAVYSWKDIVVTEAAAQADGLPQDGAADQPAATENATESASDSSSDAAPKPEPQQADAVDADAHGAKPDALEAEQPSAEPKAPAGYVGQHEAKAKPANDQ